jgi:hypothetical protein
LNNDDRVKFANIGALYTHHQPYLFVQNFAQMQKKMKKKIFSVTYSLFTGKNSQILEKKLKEILHISTWSLEGEGIVCTIFKKPFWTGCRKREH